MRSAHPVRGQTAIVGIADAASPTGDLELSGRALEAAMIREALDDAGLAITDVDAIFSAGDSMGLAEFLGIQPRWVDSTATGGSSYEIHVEHAAAAITLGLCDVAVSVYAATPHSDRSRGGAAQPGPRRPGGMYPGLMWEIPYGLRMPIGGYALAANRHMAVYGTSPEQLAQIAVSTREWACRNPRARFQEPITVDDVLASELVCTPLHKLDCCLRTDGAGAFVMCRADRARDLARPPVSRFGCSR